VNPATQELHAAIADALERLDEPGLSSESVHQARKSMKRARAALRLLREGLDGAAFRAENAALRDAGRRLAPLRAPQSVLDALQDLRRRYPEELPRARLEALERRLRAEQASGERESARAGAARLLRHSLARAERADFLGIGAGALDEGLERIYRKGRKAYAEAGQAGTGEALHEWRKQVKYLLNALAALRADGKAGGKAARRAEKLARRLGEEHDLAELEQRAPALRPVIERRRAKLRKKALALGEKLYRRKPKRFLERLATSSS
jgi:hypothetical protein